jgi:hypothetical protein
LISKLLQVLYPHLVRERDQFVLEIPEVLPNFECSFKFLLDLVLQNVGNNK